MNDLIPFENSMVVLDPQLKEFKIVYGVDYHNNLKKVKKTKRQMTSLSKRQINSFESHLKYQKLCRWKAMIELWVVPDTLKSLHSRGFIPKRFLRCEDGKSGYDSKLVIRYRICKDCGDEEVTYCSSPGFNKQIKKKGFFCEICEKRHHNFILITKKEPVYCYYSYKILVVSEAIISFLQQKIKLGYLETNDLIDEALRFLVELNKEEGCSEEEYDEFLGKWAHSLMVEQGIPVQSKK